jgi:hypothetical protein
VRLLLKHGADPLYAAPADKKGRVGRALTLGDINKKSCPKNIYKCMVKTGVEKGGEDDDDEDDDEDEDEDDSD